MKAWLVALFLLIASFIGLFLSSTVVGDQIRAQSSGVSGPRIAFESLVFDFGKIIPGELIKHDFVFTNTGTATLEISEVRPGCGCTTAGTWDRSVNPGKTGRIPLQFNSAAFNGPVAKSATVTCNDPSATNVVLQLSGTVWSPIEVIPAMTIFNVLDEFQSTETKVVRILSNMEEPVTLSDVQCSNACFRLELKTVQPGKEFELQITTVPPFASPSILAPITIRTSSPKVPVLNASAYVIVQPAVIITPPQIPLPPGRLAKAVTSTVTIQNRGTNVLAFSDPHVDSPGVEVRVQEREPGREFNLTVTFPVGFQIPPGQKVELTVRSNHPKFPIIAVPIFHSEPLAAAAPPPAAHPTVTQSISPVTRAVPVRTPIRVTAAH